MSRQEYLRNCYHFCYAKEILSQCRIINNERCIGCAYADPVQIHHDCLINSNYDTYTYHYDEALLRVCEDDVRTIFKIEAVGLDASKEDIEIFYSNFKWKWQNKNNDFKHETLLCIKNSTEILSIFN